MLYRVYAIQFKSVRGPLLGLVLLVVEPRQILTICKSSGLNAVQRSRVPVFGSLVQMALVLVSLLQSDLVHVPLLDQGVHLIGLVVSEDTTLSHFVTPLILRSDDRHLFHLLQSSRTVSVTCLNLVQSIILDSRGCKLEVSSVR